MYIYFDSINNGDEVERNKEKRSTRRQSDMDSVMEKYFII